jgi:hypothetical protein
MSQKLHNNQVAYDELAFDVNSGIKRCDPRRDRCKMLVRTFQVLTEQVPRSLHHDVVVVPVAYPQDTRGNAVASAGAREILHRLRILVSCERQEWFVSIASFPLEEVRQSLLSCRQDTHR